MGTTIGVLKGETRSLDNGTCERTVAFRYYGVLGISLLFEAIGILSGSHSSGSRLGF